MIGQTERDDKGVEAQFMKKKILALLVCSMLTLSTTVSADILDYEGTINAYKQDDKTPQTFEIDNGSGEKVTAVAKSDKVSVSAKATYIRSMPGKNGKKLARVYLGTGVERVAVCDNGWSTFWALFCLLENPGNNRFETTQLGCDDFTRQIQVALMDLLNIRFTFFQHLLVFSLEKTEY